MKRIARSLTDKYVATDALAQFEPLQRILRQHLPASTAALFSRPKQKNEDAVEWYSDLGGEPIPYAQLSPEQSANLDRLLNERLDSIKQLSSTLRSRGETAEADILDNAIRYPNKDNLYSLNGEPVITFWGYGMAPTAALPETDPTPVAPPVEIPPATAASTTPKRRAWRRWLLLLLLLLLLLGLLYYFFCPLAKDTPPEEPVVEEVEPEPEIPPEPEPEPEPDPFEELLALINAAGDDCAQLQAIFRTHPLLNSDDPRAIALKAELDTKLQQDCREELIKDAKNLCPEERPENLAPELVIVFDASGSMGYSINITTQEARQAEEMMQREKMANALSQLFGGRRQSSSNYDYIFKNPRIIPAREAANSVISKTPSDVNVGLVLVGSCPAAQSYGFFAPGRRSELQRSISSIQPKQGTPLADGVLKAGQLVDGVNKESTILVVSDGEESCEGNPCAVANALARSKPNLTINVVDILGTGAGNCLASATGGKVYTAKNADDVLKMATEAARDVLGPEHCIKPEANASPPP